jgi:hypothetical protein
MCDIKATQSVLGDLELNCVHMANDNLSLKYCSAEHRNTACRDYRLDFNLVTPSINIELYLARDITIFFT